MGKKSDFIYELNYEPAKVAYLINFDIDKSILKPDHKQWLKVKVGGEARDAQAHLKASFVIWVLGTTSRTASFSHNLNLSKNRAKAVVQYLKTELGVHKDAIPYEIYERGLSEKYATLRGKADNVEDSFDRGVLVYAHWFDTPNPVPPTIRRPPSLPKTSHLAIRFVLVKSSSASIPLPKVKVGAEEYDVIVEIYDRRTHASACYHWLGTGIRIELKIPKLKTPKSTSVPGRKTGPWHPFIDPFLRAPKDFEGPAGLTSLDILAGLGGTNAFYFGGGTFIYTEQTIKISGFDTGLSHEKAIGPTFKDISGKFKLVKCPTGLTKGEYKIPSLGPDWIRTPIRH